MTDAQRTQIEDFGLTVETSSVINDVEILLVSKDDFSSYIRADDDESAQAIIDQMIATGV